MRRRRKLKLLNSEFDSFNSENQRKQRTAYRRRRRAPPPPHPNRRKPPDANPAPDDEGEN
ncbi:putative G-protein coupled receptor [Sesbania bispinosa]|nr:putative G-protein coupled receptor [Sesbania bispinosa]